MKFPGDGKIEHWWARNFWGRVGPAMTQVDVEKQALLASSSEESNALSKAVSPSKGVSTNQRPSINNLFGASATTLIILYYAACSSTMLVINKASPRIATRLYSTPRIRL